MIFEKVGTILGMWEPYKKNLEVVSKICEKNFFWWCRQKSRKNLKRHMFQYFGFE
jgi:hypothetical protein